MEAKVLAYYLNSIGHGGMAEIFRRGADLHRETAAGIYSKPADAVTDEERQVGKRLLFSLIYGGGMGTLLRQGVASTPKDALELLRAFHQTYPGIGWESKRKKADPGTLSWHIDRRIEERGYIATLYGRHLRPHSPHVRVNALVQGCSADLMKWSMVNIHTGLIEKGYQSHIVITVHDEVGLDCAFDELDSLRELVPDWMTDQRIEAVVPIRPSCDLAWPTWGHKGKWEDVYEQWLGNIPTGGVPDSKGVELGSIV